MTASGSRVYPSRRTGGLCLRGIDPDQTWQQVESRFILKNQHPAFTPSSPQQLRPDLCPPTLDGGFVPLDGPTDRHLDHSVHCGSMRLGAFPCTIVHKCLVGAEGIEPPTRTV